MKKVIFTDFDGTVTKVDTCAAMVETFAKDEWKEINKLWEDKKLSTADCANLTFKLFNATIADIEKLMDTMEIDGYFSEFLSLCSSKGIDVYILSDGYDFNIKTILKRYGINIKYFANRLLTDSDGFSIECPHENVSCKKCGTCKTSLIKKLAGEGDQIIYIGDSYSDMCPSAIADIVFAKDVLYRYCRDNNIKAVYFRDFKDIMCSELI